MKKIISIILLTFMVMAQICTIPVSAAEAEVVYTFGTVTGEVGSEVSVSINIASSVNINSIGIRYITYDENVLEFVGFKNYGEIVTKSLFGSAGCDDTKKIISLAFTTADKYTGFICDAVFKVIASSSTPVTVAAQETVAKKTRLYILHRSSTVPLP